MDIGVAGYQSLGGVPPCQPGQVPERDVKTELECVFAWYSHTLDERIAQRAGRGPQDLRISACCLAFVARPMRMRAEILQDHSQPPHTLPLLSLKKSPGALEPGHIQ